MECEICDKPSRERVKVFIGGDKERYLFPKCVLRLARQRLEYSEAEGKYRFNRKRRKNGLVRGPILRDFGFLNGSRVCEE
jgi:hypothetical protein